MWAEDQFAIIWQPLVALDLLRETFVNDEPYCKCGIAPLDRRRESCTAPMLGAELPIDDFLANLVTTFPTFGRKCSLWPGSYNIWKVTDTLFMAFGCHSPLWLKTTTIERSQIARQLATLVGWAAAALNVSEYPQTRGRVDVCGYVARPTPYN